ncbi:hypothetical protein LIER_32435 [Lithospermum erythrorhizon]|uniref:DYW domain-containing protein n=1 Tax=Lithospermum erythrorhizon TaxID=34254 RepID=A0AAV3RXV8_LITER
MRANAMKRSLHYNRLLDAPSQPKSSSLATLSVRDTLNILINSAETKNIQLGKIIHAYIITSNPFSSYQVIENNALLNLYAKCGQLSLVQSLFDSMHKRNVVSWCSLMSAYFHNGYVSKVLELFMEVFRVDDVRPNKYVLSVVLSCCSEGRRVVEGLQCHGYVLKSGLEFHQYVKNGLLRMYLMCSLVGDAMKVLDYVPGSDAFTYNSVLKGLLDYGYINRALVVLRRMMDECLEWDNVTYVSVFGICAKSGDLKLGMQVHGRLVESGVEIDLFLGSAMIDMYGKCGQLSTAREIFEALNDQNVVSWTALLAAYLQNESFEETLELFLEMEVRGVVPNEYTYAVLLNSCAGLSALGCGNSLHAQVQKMGYTDHVIVGIALINMYSKSGHIEAASIVFANMIHRDSITWNSMISAYAHHGHGKEALNLFYNMLALEEKPNSITFVGVLSACGHLGLVDEGFYYLYKLMRDKGIEPELEHYTCILALLCNAGRLEEAENFMRTTKTNWDIVAWRTLLNACYVHRNYTLGKRVAESVLQMNPDDVGTFVLLSNMHAKAKRWDGIVKIRKLMRERNIKKEPGMSWTQIRTSTHIFVSDDNMHPDTAEIHEKIRDLLAEIKPLGYTPDISCALHDVDEEQKESSLRYHSEKLAIAYALLKTPPGAPIHVIKNLRMCDDCHSAVKLIAKVTKRVIVVRDINRFHSFRDGYCSCADYW